MKKLVLVISIALMAVSAKAQQCSDLQIESIFIDACVPGGACNNTPTDSADCEGINEMVLLKIGATPIMVAFSTTVNAAAPVGAGILPNWPNNNFLGWVQNPNTVSHTARLNATITKCGWIKDPVGGVIPANAQVIIFTSEYLDVAANSFTNLQDTLYALYQKEGNYQGHFVNSQCVGAALSPIPCTTTTTATRTLSIACPAQSCTASVVYDKTLLVNQNYGTANPDIYGGAAHFNDGATVNYDASANATYVNNGCRAPYIPITVSASAPASACSNTTPSITGIVSGPAVTYSWTTTGTGTISVPTGTLSGANTTTVTPTYTPGIGENGTITFTLSAAGKCSLAVETQTVSIFLNTIPTPTVSSSNGATLCNGNSTVLSASSTGTLTTTWSWNPGAASTSTLSVSPPTGTQIYTLTATNSCGTKNATFTVTTNPLPTLTLLNDSICANISNGILSVSGASTYTWNNGIQTTSLTASAGTYSVTGTDGNGCKSTASASIVSIALPNISTNTSAICIGVSSTLTASGGAANSYTWSPAGPSGNNTYTVTPGSTTPIVVTGANTHGCLNTHTVTINAQPTLTVNNPSTCAGQAVTLQASPSTLSTYTWTGVSSSSSTASVSPASTTPYTVVATDANGCVSNQAIATVSVTAGTQISVTSTNATPCVGSTYTLSANGATSYTWVPSSGSFNPLDGNNTQISVVQGASAVSFTVSGVGACPATSTVVTINPATPSTLTIISSPANATVCNGTPITLTASGASTYTWTPLITNGTAFTPTTSAIYSVSATDGNGCATANSTFSVTVNNIPTFTVNSPAICTGQTATLTASQSTYTYSWQGSVSTSSSVNVTPVTSPQTYTVSALDGNGCVSNVMISTVTTNTLPVLSITSNPANAAICAGGTITLSGNGATTYTWTGGISDGTPFTPASSPLTQTYSVIGTDGNGCVSAVPQTSTVTINPTLTLTVTSSPVCVGDNSIFTASGANTYTWSTLATTSSINVLAANSQTYTVVGTDANNCPTLPFVATATVNALPNISITPSSNAVCAGSTLTLTANGAGVGGNYTWNDGSTNTTLIDNPTSPTNYTVTGVDANNCQNSNSITITVNPQPIAQTITASSPVVCIGAINPPVVLSVPNAGTWIGPAPSTATISANSTSISVTQGGVYTLITSNSCGNALSPPYTLAADSVIAGFNANPTTGQTPVSVSYTNTSVALAGNTLTYSWAFGNGDNSANINPTEIFTGAATYQTTLTAVDNLGCMDTATVYIKVNDIPSIIIIPNIFSPNGDNINDEFSVTATGISNFDCKVYDRWGLLLHEWTGVDGGWDGKAKNGATCTDGTYFYLITYLDNQSKSYTKNGFFELVR